MTASRTSVQRTEKGLANQKAATAAMQALIASPKITLDSSTCLLYNCVLCANMRRVLDVREIRKQDANNQPTGAQR